MSHDHDHLSPDVQALVDEARALPRVPVSSRDAVRQRLAASLAVPLVAPPAPAPAPSSLAALRSPFTLATFVVGALSGAAAYRALAPRPAPVTVVRVVQAAPPVVAPPVIETPVVAQVAPTVDVPAAVAPAVVAADVPTHSRGGAHESDEESLGNERAVLELARTNLAHGRSSAAIEALERHARRFPHGRLGPERESTWVQALVSAGRYDSAREHAARFRRAYPGSMFQSVVDAALREIP